MLNLTIALVTLTSIFLVVYHHAGYPLVLRYLRGRKARVQTDPAKTVAVDIDRGQLPSITIVVPAYNEADFIADKIRNLAILDYPRDRLKVVIACDGSTDNTHEIAIETAAEPECRDLSITVIRFEQNRGKIALLNHLVGQVDSEIVALSDVSALVSMDALLLAAARFSDPEIGVVNGHYRLLSPGSEGEKKYWEYQSKVKAGEASLGSVIGSHGAFYLIRRKLFEQLPGDTINDDFIIPMRIVLQGYRSVYDGDIMALELEHADSDLDAGRRHRIAAGNLQQLLRLKSLLLPRYRGTAFTFASGKCLRVLMPYLMILALIGSLLLAPHSPVFLLMGLGQALGYLFYLVLEAFDLGDSKPLLQTFKYLLRGHLNSLRGSAAYLKSAIKTQFMRDSRALTTDQLS